MSCADTRSPNRRSSGRFVAALLAAVACAPLAPPAAAAGVDLDPAARAEAVELFEKKIRPVLVEKCQSCHGPDKQKGGLRVDSAAALLTGGDAGPAVVPGDPDAARLIAAVRYADDHLKMPPKAPLKPEQVADLERWVKLGALWPGADPRPGAAAVTAAAAGHAARKPDPAAQRAHWSFQPIRPAAPPTVKDADWPATPIDRFVLARLEQAGLAPAEPADKRTLIRRATFDLTGLPPTPAEVDAFLADDAPSAFDRVVDRLLASPAYGERWARHWLDVVRFAETNGHNRDFDKPNMYRYRDYVIESLNADLPFDQFVREQVAGDLMPPRPSAIDPRLNARVLATGAFWSFELVYRPPDPVEQRAEQVDAQIDVLGKAFLGLTVACARCHDHKFDPIPTADYYALAGVFHSTKGVQRPATLDGGTGGLPLPTPDDFPPYRDPAKPVGPPMAMASAEAEDPRYRVYEVRLPDKLDARCLPIDPKVADVPIHLRGEVGQYGPIVPRGFLSALPGGSPAAIPTGTSGRRELADWLTDPANPLTARVIVNRLWRHHFGRGLVDSPDDFGLTGERPSHPELLDWLADRLVKDGWSLKAMHRRMVLSRAYQTSSRASDAALAADPDNRLLQHMPIRRLEGEAVRDAVLAVAGTLDPTPYGPGVMPHLTPFMFTRYRPPTGPVDGGRRRSVYITVRRNFLNPMLLAFDFPVPSEPAGRRSATNVPAQALALLNNEFVHQQARAWGERVAAADGPAADRAAGMFERAVGRPPTAEELSDLLGFVERRRPGPGAGDRDPDPWVELAHALFNTKGFVYVR